MFLENGDALRKYFDTDAGAIQGTTVCYVWNIVIHLLLRLIKMQYTEQDVCLSTGNRQILGKQEGRTDKSGEKGQLGWKRRSEEESGLEDTPFVLGRQNTGNTALHEQLHSTCRQISQPDSGLVSKQLYRTSRAGSQFKVGARTPF